MDIDKSTWSFNSHTFDCSKPLFIGVLNVTPDSFSDGGKYLWREEAVSHAVGLIKSGADIIDIGGESTRPGSDEVSARVEIDRIIPVIEGLAELNVNVPISIDTRKLEVAEVAVKSGATIINDVSALRDSQEMGSFIAENDLGLILMHMLGRPKTMQIEPSYENVIDEVSDFLEERLSYAESCGVKSDAIVLDPGIGFGKLLEHNLSIINNGASFNKLNRPMLIGPSRKRFIGEITGKTVDNREPGTIAACIMALEAGYRLFRIHEVDQVKQAIDVAWALMNPESTIISHV
ncbi:MAG TPA: dihydropteroate synthase [bacterium]